MKHDVFQKDNIPLPQWVSHGNGDMDVVEPEVLHNHPSRWRYCWGVRALSFYDNLSLASVVGSQGPTRHSWRRVILIPVRKLSSPIVATDPLS